MYTQHIYYYTPCSPLSEHKTLLSKLEAAHICSEKVLEVVSHCTFSHVFVCRVHKCTCGSLHVGTFVSGVGLLSWILLSNLGCLGSLEDSAVSASPVLGF